MIENKKVTAVILAAGSSTRFGKTTNKNLEVIHGKTVLSYSIQAFSQNKYIDDIIITAKETDMTTIHDILNKEKLNKNIKIVLGGKTRNESVKNSIEKTESDIVIIHDGARPAIKQKYIDECIENMTNFKGVTIGVRSKDTVKISDCNNIVVNTTKRNNTWLTQTPQCFDRRILLDMHNKFKNDEVTDDCMLLEKNGYNVKIIEGDYTNIKITTYEDIDIIKKFLKNR